MNDHPSDGPDPDREADADLELDPDHELDPSLDLDAREAARARRRDREAEAERRALLRPGMGKVFKQIQDSWGEKASRDPKGARRTPRGGP